MQLNLGEQCQWHGSPKFIGRLLTHERAADERLVAILVVTLVVVLVTILVVIMLAELLGAVDQVMMQEVELAGEDAKGAQALPSRSACIRRAPSST